MKRHAEVAADQFGDATRGPKIGAETVGGWLLAQPLPNQPVLFGGEKAGASRGRLGDETRIAFGPVSGHPLGNRDSVNAEKLGYVRLRPAAQNLVDSYSSCRLQRGSRSFASHAADDNSLQPT